MTEIKGFLIEYRSTVYIEVNEQRSKDKQAF